MTFTYAISTTPTDLTLVRFYTGDTVSETAMWQDDEINMILAVDGSVGLASQTLLERKITEIANNPDMKADWLQINWGTSLEALQTALANVKRKFGLGWRDSSGGQHSYRPDTLQKEAPDYGEE